MSPLILLGACSPSLYYPTMVTAPSVEETGDLQFNSGGSYERDGTGYFTGKSFEFNGSYCFHPSLFVSLSVSGGIPFSGDSAYNHLFGDIGIGTFKSRDNNFFIGVMIGTGYGKSTITYRKEIHSEEFLRVFIQPYFGWEIRRAGINLSPRLGILETGEGVCEYTWTVKLGFEQLKAYVQSGLVFVGGNSAMSFYNAGLSFLFNIFSEP